MYKNFAPRLGGRYLSSNVNITVPDKSGNYVSVPVGGRYQFSTVSINTKHHRQIVSENSRHKSADSQWHKYAYVDY